MKQYMIKPITTGLFSGSLSEKKLEDFLNQHGAKGWKFVRSIHETKKVLFLFAREAHFVIFERDTSSDQPIANTTQMLSESSNSDTDILLREILLHLQNDPTPHLLRQLMRSYQIEPEV